MLVQRSGLMWSFFAACCTRSSSVQRPLPHPLDQRYANFKYSILTCTVDIYLNAVSQKLRAFHEKYYRTSSQPLSVDVLRRFVNWECSARDFKDWLINHGLSKLLAPPSTSTPDAASDNPPRPARPQIICCARDLSVALGFVRQQYNLISLVCYVTSTADRYQLLAPMLCRSVSLSLPVWAGVAAPSRFSRPRLSLVRLTQANKQVLLIDVLALAEEARLLWRGSRDCDIKQAPFVKVRLPRNPCKVTSLSLASDSNSSRRHSKTPHSFGWWVSCS